MSSAFAPGVVGTTTLIRTASVLARAPAEAVAWARGTIVFSACNEDSASELRAFGPLEGRRVMCVTAGGGRVLNLLAGRPKMIWAVDLNPAQNALLELKIAALRELDHGAYLRLLGVHPERDRLALYHRVRQRLSTGAQHFFDDHSDLVRRGVLLQGKLERFFTRLALVLRFAHPLGLGRLFSFGDLAEQRRFLSRWDTPLWRAVARNVGRRSILRAFSGDPGFYRYVPADVPLHHALYDRVHRYLWNHVARENPLLQLVFFGRYVYEPALPIYLNAATYDRIKAAAAEVHIETITATVEDALDYAGSESFDAFSLSDISSYLDDAAHHRLFDGVLRSARPAARLCSRSNLHHRPLSLEQARRVERERDLERILAAHDHSCVHDFLVGAIA
jgi:S-adenosylmethionine-diacylglycerol 3-amino-3-carboxypropyl transferase